MAAKPSWNNQGMTALLATAQGDSICATGLTATPSSGGRIDVYVNDLRWLVGNAVKTKGVYFSGNAGTTARAYGAAVAGDTCHLGTLGAVLGTTTADLISFDYNV